MGSAIKSIKRWRLWSTSSLLIILQKQISVRTRNIYILRFRRASFKESFRIFWMF